MIELSLDNFHLHNKAYTRLFNFKKSLSISRYTALEQKFKGYVDKDEAFERLKLRTSAEYYNEVYAAQMSALSLSESLFPAYKFIFPDVLWMTGFPSSVLTRKVAETTLYINLLPHT